MTNEADTQELLPRILKAMQEADVRCDTWKHMNPDCLCLQEDLAALIARTPSASPPADDQNALKIAMAAFNRISNMAFAAEYHDGSSTSVEAQREYRKVAAEASSSIASPPAVNSQPAEYVRGYEAAREQAVRVVNHLRDGSPDPKIRVACVFMASEIEEMEIQDLLPTESTCPHLHQDFPGTPANKCLDCGVALPTEGRPPQPTVESALAQLREWFPNQPHEIHLRDACKRLDISIRVDGVQRGDAINSPNGIFEAMQKVREWKEQQDA